MRAARRVVQATVFYLLLSVGLFVLGLDWFGGCGEVFVAADGSTLMGECHGREFIQQLIKGDFK